jgi:acetoin utilization deacetylase AcuC-like enzyme
METMIAARLARQLREAIEDLDVLEPKEAAANLRRALLCRCVFCRSLLRVHPESYRDVVDRLKREQMLLVLTRRYRVDPESSPLLDTPTLQ